MPYSFARSKGTKRDECFLPGDTVYLVHSNLFIREATLLSQNDYGMCSIRFTEGVGGIRVRCTRLHKNKADAEKRLGERRLRIYPT